MSDGPTLHLVSARKVCAECRVVKPVGPNGDFHRDKTHRDGYKSVCKECRSKPAEVIPLPRKSPEELERDCRAKAIRRLIEDHRREFDKLLGRYRREVGLADKWIEL